MLHALVLASLMTIPAPNHGNLVVNGDFSQGNKGFTTEYSYSDDVQADGYLCVGANPHNAHPGGLSMFDHTSGSGNMLIVNGSTVANTAIWEQKIKVAPNHKYSFGLWTASWSQSNEVGDYSPARLVVYINGKAVNKPFSTEVKSGLWTKLVATWSSGDAQLADIRIVDENLDGLGNDFAIDDIVFHD